MPNKRVVIVDDEENIGRSLRMILEREGYSVALAHSAADFRRNALTGDVYLFDVRLPDGSGIDLLRQVTQGETHSPVLMISGQATIAEAVEATRLGAYDFLEKPLSRDKVLLSLKNAFDQCRLQEENERLRELVGDGPKMLGEHPSFLRAVEQATMAARCDARVLLTGESGTGKELLASHIHHSSPYAKGPFIKVNCAAIPTDLLESELFGHEKGAFTGALATRKGKFELAHEGTLFLDEVGDLHAASQAKLLRVLQEGEFQRVGGERSIRSQVRVVAATNRDLHEMTKQDKFREDLYYRLCVMPIRLPALRERASDIPALSRYFLDDFCKRNGFRSKQIDSAVFAQLQSYTWPGNARELRNVIERMAILSPDDQVGVEAIPLEIRHAPRPSSQNGLQEAREAAERDHIERALEMAKWNVSSAARALGVERTNLHKRMRALGVRRSESGR